MRKLWEDLRQTLWVRPAIWAVALSLLAIGLVAIERRMDMGDPANLPWLATNGVEGTLTLLSVVSTSMLSAVTIVFSITIIAVNQAANAYSPRILAQYLRDTANHHVMGILIGTFLFSLFTLRGVGATPGEEFVPVIASNVVLLLAVVSLGAFIYFLNHVGESIKVDSIIDLILSQTRALVHAPYPHEVGEPWPSDLPDDPRQPVVQSGSSHDKALHLIRSQQSGYVRLIDVQQLFKAACAADAVAWLHVRVGDYVLPDAPLVTLSPAARVTEKIAKHAAQSIVLGTQQTMEQDALFGIRQISDIALRAISPGINDPSTALNCIDALATLLYHWHYHADVTPNRADAAGTLRLVAPYPDFEQAFNMAFVQIRHYGKSDLAVIIRLLDSMARLAEHIVQGPERALLWRFVAEIADAARANIQSPADRRRIDEQLRQLPSIFGKDVDDLLLSA